MGRTRVFIQQRGLSESGRVVLCGKDMGHLKVLLPCGTGVVAFFVCMFSFLEIVGIPLQ